MSKEAPLVIINSNIDIDGFYNGIMDGLNARYHAPGNSFPIFDVSPEEQTEISSLSSYAGRSNGIEVLPDGLHCRMPDGSVVHIERVIT